MEMNSVHDISSETQERERKVCEGTIKVDRPITIKVDLVDDLLHFCL